MSVFKSAKTSAEITVPIETITEPILSFVNTVKTNPSRFTFKVVNGGLPDRVPVYHSYKYLVDKEGRCSTYKAILYKFKDINSGDSYEILIFNYPFVCWGDISIEYSDSTNLITCNDSRLKFITQLEWLYIEEQLYFPYITRLKEIHNKKVTRKSLNNYHKLGRERKEREIINKSQREEYCNIYCKGE
tara:strand:- start:1044 stop:1607 length:564 start_codon:yes stop_codon:yes gene_type:complete